MLFASGGSEVSEDRHFLSDIAVYDVCVSVAGSDEDKSTLQSSTVISNLAYENTAVCGNDIENTDGGKEDASYDAINKPTAVVQPVKRATDAKDETIEANQYAVLNHTADKPLATTIAERSYGYDVLGVGTDGSDKRRSAKLSDGKHPSLPADGDDGTYAVPEDKKPNVSADVRTTMPPAENEYSYATPDVKRPIHASLMHVTEGENAVTDQQVNPQPSGYEEVVISAPEHNQPNSEGEGVYSDPVQERKISSGPSAVPPGTEYSYARPDVKRPTAISSDRLVIGPAVTERREEDGGVQDRIGDQEDYPYAVPDQVTNTGHLYATPDIQKAGSKAPDRVVVGKDEYAVSAKRITLPRAGPTDKSVAKRVPSNPLQHYTEGEDQYAVGGKKPSSPSKGDVQSPSIAQDRFTVNESEYAVSSKQSKDPKRDRDRGSGVLPEHYMSGENQYAVSGKSRSLPRRTKKDEDSGVAISVADDDVQYAKVKKN